MIHRNGMLVSLRRKQARIVGCLTSEGYTVVPWWSGRRWLYRQAHVLVLETFVGSRPRGMVCRHLDGNPSNNHISNLRWGTVQDNIDDRSHHGRTAHGSHHYKAKLTLAAVAEIRRRRATGEVAPTIASDFGIHPDTVYDIASRRTWKDC